MYIIIIYLFLFTIGPMSRTRIKETIKESIEKPTTSQIITPTVKNEVNQKWFSLYNWISFSELRQTVIIDYLSILAKINIPFGILFVLTGVINYYMWRDGIQTFGLLYVLAGGYLLTFTIMFWKMIQRSWIFLQISNVIFTDSHIWVGNQLVSLDNYESIRESIEEYGKIFHEQLGKESQINQKTKEFKDSLFGSKSSNSWSSSSSWFDDIWDLGSMGKEAGALILVILLLVGTYWLSLYVFYAIWWIFAFTLSYFFVGIMKLIVFLQNKEEVKINKHFESLDNTSKSLQSSTDTLISFIQKNKEGDWTEKNEILIKSMKDTLSLVYKGLSESKEIYKLLNNSKYKDVFNFKTFHNWVNLQITDPTRKLLELLITLGELTDKQMTHLTKQSVNTTDSQLKWQYDIQIERLRLVRSNLNVQIIEWTNLLEKLQSEVFQKLHS